MATVAYPAKEIVLRVRINSAEERVLFGCVRLTTNDRHFAFSRLFLAELVPRKGILQKNLMSSVKYVSLPYLFRRYKTDYVWAKTRATSERESPRKHYIKTCCGRQFLKYQNFTIF